MQFEGILDEIRLFIWHVSYFAATIPRPNDSPAADLNPIGAISKVDLKRFIIHAGEHFDLPILERSVYLGYRRGPP